MEGFGAALAEVHLTIWLNDRRRRLSILRLAEQTDAEMMRKVCRLANASYFLPVGFDSAWCSRIGIATATLRLMYHLELCWLLNHPQHNWMAQSKRNTAKTILEQFDSKHWFAFCISPERLVFVKCDLSKLSQSGFFDIAGFLRMKPIERLKLGVDILWNEILRDDIQQCLSRLQLCLVMMLISRNVTARKALENWCLKYMSVLL